MNAKHYSQRPFRRLLEAAHDDPLSGLANLFDIAMVFVVSLLIALAAKDPVKELLGSSTDFSMARHSDKNQIPPDGRTLEQYRIGGRQVGGKGERLGIAYQLPSGEVIYVPDPHQPAEFDSE